MPIVQPRAFVGAILLLAALAPVSQAFTFVSAAPPLVGSPVDGPSVDCTNTVDCYAWCVLRNPTAPLIYFQCAVWALGPTLCYADIWSAPVCPPLLSPPPQD